MVMLVKTVVKKPEEVNCKWIPVKIEVLPCLYASKLFLLNGPDCWENM
jgi:hypothetical protein